jgi:hypothetical protein
MQSHTAKFVEAKRNQTTVAKKSSNLVASIRNVLQHEYYTATTAQSFQPSSRLCPDSRKYSVGNDVRTAIDIWMLYIPKFYLCVSHSMSCLVVFLTLCVTCAHFVRSREW